MKASKRMAVMMMGLLVIAAVACGGGGRYATAKVLIGKQISIIDRYAGAMEKANSPQEVAAALNAYAADTQDLIPDMKKFQEQFPEMKAQDEPPAELKPEMAKLQEAMGRMMSASMKAAKYMQDPVVQEAQKKLGEAMSGMKQ